MSDDPTADFLAREKAILGDDADLFASGEVPTAPSGIDAFPDIDDLDGSLSPAAKEAPKPSGIDAFPALDEPIGSSEVRVTGSVGLSEDPAREQFESAFPDISSEIPVITEAPKPVFNAHAAQPYGSSPYPPVSAPQPRAASSILPAPQLTNLLPGEDDEDTEPIREWRERQAEEIKQRNEAAREKREEMANKAEKDIDQFYEDYNKEKEKNIRENKEKEAAFLEKQQEDLSKGTTWERITDLIGLENSQSKTIRPSAPGGSDLQRFKEILLSLRREGDRAPGAAGF